MDSFIETQLSSENIFQLDNLTRALQDRPKDYDLVIATGQHGKSEPLAASVGKSIAHRYSEKYLPTIQTEFPEGLDYSDAPPGEYTGTIEPKGVQQMRSISDSHLDKVVFNFHETYDPWKMSHGDKFVIDLIMSPQLSPPAQTELTSKFLELNSLISSTGLEILLTSGSMTDLGLRHKTRDQFDTVPPNMLAIDFHTPKGTYRENGRNKPKLFNTAPEVQTLTDRLQLLYTATFEQLLPVLSSTLHETLQNPKNILKL